MIRSSFRGLLAVAVFAAMAMPTEARTNRPYLKRLVYSESNAARVKIVPWGNAAVATVKVKATRWPRVYVRVARFELPVFPHSTIALSDSGRWMLISGSLQSECALRIYRTSDGTFRSVKFADLLSDGDFKAMWMTNMRSEWLNEADIDIDEASGVVDLVVRASAPGVGPEDEISATIQVGLEDGRLRSERKDHLPQPRVFLRTLTACEIDPEFARSQPRCNPGESWEAEACSEVEDLGTDLIELQMPTYPEIALRARITGSVHLLVSVDPDGMVECVQTLRGLPLGITPMAEEKALTWLFQVDAKNPHARCGAVSLEYRWVSRSHFAY